MCMLRMADALTVAAYDSTAIAIPASLMSRWEFLE